MPSNTPLGFPYPLGTDRLSDGDDVIRNLATAVNDRVGVSAAGVVNINVTTVGNVTTAPVVFAAGLFSAPPNIVTSVSGNPINIFTGVTAVTAAGANIIAVRTAAPGNVTVNWYAIQIGGGT